ncbi:hypothetical protein A2671_01190 [Candidatus Kaiserbacteria bacterium RIFCSPHIGHO2_01_FULL_49_13]|uniref:Co-chaperonin GroES n=1 Tax=Candidatus Kaiserbacteria bacterium RIFCSPHIGHO2_01_FULL_49_13 TaxID=1798477 RepID=A0A1F6CD98_9BACT|nr:MAG: hypothetical protein A2671_01190 [Candidatus Kaiserbacteria bacterium RIFCSPHIGHO2_01_FULL_49_13]
MAKQTSKSSKSRIQPLGDRVLVKPLSEDEAAKKLSSGIIIPATVDKEKTDRGMVMAVGPGKINDSGKIVPMHVKVGDKVLFQWGDKMEVDDQEYFVVSESNILAIIK